MPHPEPRFTEAVEMLERSIIANPWMSTSEKIRYVFDFRHPDGIEDDAERLEAAVAVFERVTGEVATDEVRVHLGKFFT